MSRRCLLHCYFWSIFICGLGFNKTARKNIHYESSVVGIVYEDYIAGTGVIVHPTFILTVCHVLIEINYDPLSASRISQKLKERDEFWVHASMSEISSELILKRDHQIVPVIDLYVHQKCEWDGVNMPSPLFDLGLMKLDKNLRFNSFVQQYHFPEAVWDDAFKKIIRDGATCNFFGYGNIENGHFKDLRHSSLRKLKLNVVPVTQCQSKLKDSLILTSSQNYSDNLCHGDFGGPLICKGHLLGLASWGGPCVEFPKYGLFVTVRDAVELFLSYGSQKSRSSVINNFPFLIVFCISYTIKFC